MYSCFWWFMLLRIIVSIHSPVSLFNALLFLRLLFSTSTCQMAHFSLVAAYVLCAPSGIVTVYLALVLLWRVTSDGIIFRNDGKVRHTRSETYKNLVFHSGNYDLCTNFIPLMQEGMPFFVMHIMFSSIVQLNY